MSWLLLHQWTALCITVFISNISVLYHCIIYLTAAPPGQSEFQLISIVAVK